MASYAPNNLKPRIIDTINRTEAPKVPTLDVINSGECEKLQNFKRDVLENKQKIALPKEAVLSSERSNFGQLLHLKSIEQIGHADMTEIFARQMFQHEFGEKLNLQELHKEDEIFEELLFLNYYLNGVLIPQNNAKKELVKNRVITEEHRSSRNKKLNE